jgi:uncharacterized protein YbjQ (UPF0145 family)
VPPQPAPTIPVPEPAPRKATFVATDLPVVTGDAVPGREVEDVIGVVVGVTTRSRDVKVGPDTIALLAQARQDAIAALVGMAVDAGADAVVGLRFDGGKISDTLSEITAYGTAVTLVGAAAQPTHAVTEPAEATVEDPSANPDLHAASPIPMDDPDPVQPFGTPVPPPADSVHEQQLRQEHDHA